MYFEMARALGVFLFMFFNGGTSMTPKRTYEELERTVLELEKLSANGNRAVEAGREKEELFRNVYNTAPLARTKFSVGPRKRLLGTVFLTF
jgi:hypothetical protein